MSRRSAGSVQQTLWLRDAFTFIVKRSLTLRNVRVSGQKLIKVDCEEEWCTHCLVPPYVWPSLSNNTVIDNHPVVDETDPSYVGFQCTKELSSFFLVSEASLTIENCTLDNIRIRAANFISLEGSSNLTISQTNISRMDFTAGFIGGSAQEVHLSDCLVTGFNRDHAYVRNYPGDAGLLQLDKVGNFTLIHSVFEDNLLLLDPNVPYHFIIAINDYDHLVIFYCSFRRTMGGLMLEYIKFARTIPYVLISRCLFEDNYMIGNAFVQIFASTSVEITITECSFKNNAASFLYFLIVKLHYNSSLQFNNCEFFNNWPYMSTYSLFANYPSKIFSLESVTSLIISNCLFLVGNYDIGSSLIAQLVAARLINPSKELLEDFLEVSPQKYTNIMMVTEWVKVHVVNVTLEETTQFDYCWLFLDSLAESQLQVDHLIMKNVSANTALYVDRIAKLDNPVVIQNCIFQEVSGALIYVQGYNNTIVYISNCLFVDNKSTGPGAIQLYGTSAYVIATKWWTCWSVSALLKFVSATNGEKQNLIVQDCEFVKNTVIAGDITVLSGSSRVSVSLEVSRSSFQDISGSAIYLGNVELRQAAIRNCSFTGGKVAPRTGLIYIAHVKGLLTLEDAYFSEYNNSESYLVQISTPSTTAQEKLTRLVRVVIRDCTFLAALKLEGQLLETYVETVNCSFLRNQGVAIWSYVAVVRDHLSLFQANTAEGYPCYFQDQQSNASFEGTEFRANTATKTPGGCLYIRGQSSSAIFTNCLFQANTAKGTTGGVMRIEQFVNVEIHNCSFFNNLALMGSALYLLSVEVTLQIVNTSFVGNKGEGVIHLVNSKLKLASVFVSRNRGRSTGGLVVVNSEVIATDSVFTELEGQQGCVLLVGSNSNVTLETTQVRDTYCSGNMMDISGASNLFFTDCQLSSLASGTRIIAVNAGRAFQAISLHVNNIAAAFLSVVGTDVSVRDSVFLELVGQVFASRESTLLSIHNSSLSNVNETGLLSCSRVQLVELQSVRATTVRVYQMGIYLEASEVRIAGCIFQAILGGQYGALLLKNSQLHLSGSSFLSNRALASNSKGGALSLLNSSSVISNCTFISNSAYLGGAIHWTTLPPKQQDNVFAQNRAFYGPVMASETNRLQVFNLSSLMFVSGQIVTRLLLVGLLDPSNQLVTVESNKYWLKSGNLSGNLEAKADRGLLVFTKFVIGAPPGQTVSILLNANATVSKISIQVRHCKAGEVLDKCHCVVCPSSTYSVDLLDCSRCPSGGVCPGDGNLYPEPSYWRPSETYNGVFACAYAAACKGHSNYTSQLGRCAELYEGNLCQKCVTGAGRNGPDKCAICPIPAVNYITIAAALGLTAAMIVVMIRSALKSAQRESSLASTIMKILLNYVQVTAMTARFPLNWPPVLEQFFAFHEYSGNSGKQYMSVDCLVRDSVFREILVMSLLPLALAVFCTLFWLLMGALYSLIRLSNKIREKWMCSTIVSLLYFHPMIMRTTFSALQCFTIQPGEQWLKEELTIRCWTGQHSFFALAVALPAAMLWGIGIPTLTLLLLVRYRKRLRESRVRVIVGYLCVNYKPEFYFWEVIIIYRKLSVAALLAFSSNLSATAQGLLLILLLSVTALLQFNYAPFKRIALNSCELLGEVTVLVTAYAGLFFKFCLLSAEVKAALFIFVIIMNSIFLLKLAKVLFRNKLRRMFRRLTRSYPAIKARNILMSRKMWFLTRLHRQFYDFHSNEEAELVD